MDERVLEIKQELQALLPDAGDYTLLIAAEEWVSWIGRTTSVRDADAGLRADFLRRFGGASPIEGSHVWAR